MARPEQVSVIAPAKVNLCLVVGGRRDDGYHDVVTVLLALDLHDTVDIEIGGPLTVICVPDIGVPSESNLAAKAARALGRRIGREPDARITIAKRIPDGAGLGGGSSDAAATIAGLAGMWGLDRGSPVIAEVAAEVGADVPFFLGGGCALFGARGDVLVRTLPAPELTLALVNPGIPVPTVAAYAAFDRLLAPPALGPEAMIAAIEARDVVAIAAALSNNLTEASVGLVPEVGDGVALLRGADASLGTAMTGSGSTVFGVFAEDGPAEAAVAEARARGWWAAVAHGVTGGAFPVDEHDGGGCE